MGRIKTVGALSRSTRKPKAVKVVSSPRSGGNGMVPTLPGLTVTSELPQRNLDPRNNFHQVRRRNSPKTS